jgi:hypothetical protein
MRLRHVETRRADNKVKRPNFAAAAVLAAGLALVPASAMAQNPRGQTALSKAEISSVLRMNIEVAERLGAVREILEAQKEAKIPAMIGHSDPQMRRLIWTLSRLNETLKQYNHGNDVVPLSGSNERELFRSLTRWLARTGEHADYLDPEGIDILEMRLSLALSTPTATRAAEAVSEALPKKLGQCPSLFTQSKEWHVVKNRVREQVHKNSGRLRGALGASEDQSVIIKITIKVTGKGELDPKKGSALCDGGPCGRKADVLDESGIDLKNLTVPPPYEPCMWDIRTVLVSPR